MRADISAGWALERRGPSGIPLSRTATAPQPCARALLLASLRSRALSLALLSPCPRPALTLSLALLSPCPSPCYPPCPSPCYPPCLAPSLLNIAQLWLSCRALLSHRALPVRPPSQAANRAQKRTTLPKVWPLILVNSINRTQSLQLTAQSPRSSE